MDPLYVKDFMNQQDLLTIKYKQVFLNISLIFLEFPFSSDF